MSEISEFIRKGLGLPVQKLKEVAPKFTEIIEDLYKDGYALIIPSAIEYYHQSSSLKGVFFYQQLIVGAEISDNGKKIDLAERKKEIILHCEKKIKEIKLSETERSRFFMRGSIISVASVVLGSTLTGWIQWLQKEPPTKGIDTMTVFVMKDTVYKQIKKDDPSFKKDESKDSTKNP